VIAGYIYEMEKILFSMSLCHLQSPSNTIHEIASGCSICIFFLLLQDIIHNPKESITIYSWMNSILILHCIEVLLVFHPQDQYE
jgi:acetylornithine deacetylase/succinyl-diaminopimelate desuccinylase-like protein